MRLSWMWWYSLQCSVLFFSSFADSVLITTLTPKHKHQYKLFLDRTSFSILSISSCNIVFFISPPYISNCFSASVPFSSLHITLICEHTLNCNRGTVMQYWWKCGVVTGRSGWSLHATHYSYGGDICVWWLWLIAAVAHTLICGERDVAGRQDFDDEVTHACLLLLVIHGVCHAENK